jgi:pimeloyl-ACP methyl ester carboxylesterase
MPVPQLLGYRTRARVQAAKGDRVANVVVKRPIVLLRGLGRSSSFWLGFEDSMAKYADLHFIDLLGTGRSPSAFGHWTVQAHARDVWHTIGASASLPVHVAAISFGGMVCLQMLADLGDSGDQAGICSAAVLSASARATGARRIALPALRDLAFNLTRPFPRHATFAHHLVSSNHLSHAPDLPDVWDAIYQKEGFSRLATMGQLVGAARFHGGSVLSAIRTPVLFVVSRGDRLVDWRNSVAMSEMVAGARLYVYDTPGHDIPTEVPEDLAARLATFFAQNE